MRAHRITSRRAAGTDEAAPPRPVAATRAPAARNDETPARRAARCIAAVLALAAASPAGAAPASAVADAPASASRPSGDDPPGPDAAAAASDAPPAPADAVTRPSVAPPHAIPPMGRAVGLLPPRHPKGRGRHAPEQMPGCTATATLDAVSAALQAGPFGRGKGLAIMQFRNVVTDTASDGRVACHSDVLLSDGSLHRADYGLRQARRGTRLHIEVAGGREDAAPLDAQPPGTPAPDTPAPLPPDIAAPPAPALPPPAPGTQVPAT